MSTTRILHCTIAALSLAGLLFAPGAVNARDDDPDSDYYLSFRGDRSYNGDRQGWGDRQGSRSRRATREPEDYDSSDTRSTYTRGTPLLAVVALAEQRVSIYGTDGRKMMGAPVSSGQNGLETPSGIFSVVQKEADHHSTLFDDASMPFMERITWTGIALHAGVLPGYPASHGCVRMPHRFAEQLFDVSKMGMRVLIVRDDIVPADIAQPAMFTPAVKAEGKDSLDLQFRLQEIARAKSAELNAAQRREKDAKQAASKKAGDAAAAVRAEQSAEAALAKAEADLKDAERAAEATPAPDRAEAAKAQAENNKAQATAKVEAAKAQLQAAKADTQEKTEASRRANEEARDAGAAAARTADASQEAQQNLWPVSVFISRKTQRLYVRRNNMPVYESHVIIRNADKPIGTFVFTALDYEQGTMRWNVVSMFKTVGAANEPRMPEEKGRRSVRQGEAAPADLAGAQTALDRITIPPEAQERISTAVLTGSSLIISDEGLHSETGKDTDFIVVMMGEPMGGLNSRHKPTHRDDYAFDGFFGPFGGGSRDSRGGGGGFPFFFRN